MPLTFQTLCSGSAANCLLLRNGSTTLLFDAGFRSQRKCREMLDPLLPDIDGVVVSHLHGDHIRYPSLRVLHEHGVPIYVHEDEAHRLASKHYNGRDFPNLDVRTYGWEPFALGGMRIAPFQAPHDGNHLTFGFEVTVQLDDGSRRLVLATDFWDWEHVADWFVDADFIYVEANHDRELLWLRPNPNSQFHLNNDDCGLLLRQAFDASSTPPRAVMLGHLSDQRNTPDIAVRTVSAALHDAGHGDVELLVAPRDVPSDVIVLD